MRNTKFIQLYHNGIALCGSDYARVIPCNLTTRQINNRLKLFKANIESLKNIKPSLKTGLIEYKIEY